MPMGFGDGDGPPFPGSAIPGVRHSRGRALGLGLGLGLGSVIGLGLGRPREWRTPGMADRNLEDGVSPMGECLGRPGLCPSQKILIFLLNGAFAFILRHLLDSSQGL